MIFDVFGSQYEKQLERHGVCIARLRLFPGLVSSPKLRGLVPWLRGAPLPNIHRLLGGCEVLVHWGGGQRRHRTNALELFEMRADAFVLDGPSVRVVGVRPQGLALDFVLSGSEGTLQMGESFNRPLGGTRGCKMVVPRCRGFRVKREWIEVRGGEVNLGLAVGITFLLESPDRGLTDGEPAEGD